MQFKCRNIRESLYKIGKFQESIKSYNLLGLRGTQGRMEEMEGRGGVSRLTLCVVLGR